MLAGTVFGAGIVQLWSTRAFGGALAWVTGNGATKAVILVTLVFVKLFHTVFFSPLRVDELESLSGQAWYSLVEMTVALIAVGQRINTGVVMTAAAFLVLKYFHWLCASRADNTTKTVRLALVLALLHALDFVVLRKTYQILFGAGRETENMNMVVLVFAAELAVLDASLIAATGRFILNMLPRRWGKFRRISLFAVNLATDVAKLVVYFGFSALMMANFCLPLHVFGETYATVRLTITKTREFIWYRQLHGRYQPSAFERASEGDLRKQNICIICRENMCIRTHEGYEAPARLPCGHILHYVCLMEWLERSTSCPTCRLPF
jgi:E3 ubiquitin-protein ligase synoviolin